MLRYRCPHCSQLLQAHELRAGKKSVCNSCMASHVIPADRGMWLNEVGEPLLPRHEHAPAIAEPIAVGATASASPVSAPEAEPDAAPPVELTREIEQPAPSATPAPRVVPRPTAPEPRVSATTATPPPAPAPTLTPPTRGVVSAEPAAPVPQPAPVLVAGTEDAVPVQTQADIAAALTEAITLRMKPRRRPRRDLRPSTAVWLVLTGLGAAFLFVTLFTVANYAPWVKVLGGIQIMAGYGWIVALTSQRDRQRGLLCAIPPVAAYYLAQGKYAKFRPLRFVATGLALFALAGLAPRLAATTRAWVGSDRPAANNGQQPDPADLSKLQQLRDLRDRKAYDKLVELMRTLTTTDTMLSEDAKNRAELAAELRVLCAHPDTGVKVAAMGAYGRWGGDDAREVCMAALGPNGSEEEKEKALELLPKWKDSPAAPLVAQTIAALIGRPGRVSTKATAALEEIGGLSAERALLDLLFRTDDGTTKLVVLNLLEKVGGPTALTGLPKYANTILDRTIKSRELDTVEIIRNRPPP